MKKLALVCFILLFTCVMTAQASALADLAKKEKARRAALHHEGKEPKVFTNADVANLKSELSFEVRNESGEIQDWFAPKEAVQQTENEQSNEEANQLKQERAELEQKAKNAQETINSGGGYYTRNIGNQYKEKRDAEQRMREIDSKLAETDKDSESENQ